MPEPAPVMSAVFPFNVTVGTPPRISPILVRGGGGVQWWAWPCPSARSPSADKRRPTPWFTQSAKNHDRRPSSTRRSGLQSAIAPPLGIAPRELIEAQSPRPQPPCPPSPPACLRGHGDDGHGIAAVRRPGHVAPSAPGSRRAGPVVDPRQDISAETRYSRPSPCVLAAGINRTRSQPHRAGADAECAPHPHLTRATSA